MIICEANFSSFAVKLNIISRLTAFCLENCVQRCYAPCVFLIFEWLQRRKQKPGARNRLIPNTRHYIKDLWSLFFLAPVVGVPALFVGTELAFKRIFAWTYARVDAAVARKTATCREGQRAFGNDLYCYALGSAICFLHFFYAVGLFHINFLAALDVKTLGETFERTVADTHALEVVDGS